MNPELKAKELVGKYKPYMYCYAGSGMLANSYDESVANDYAKKSALIAVDEMISKLEKLHTPEYATFIEWDQLRDEVVTMNGYEMIGYYQQVKRDIEKL